MFFATLFFFIFINIIHNAQHYNHGLYMRRFLVQFGTYFILYHYVDWTITVPLQMIELCVIFAVKSDLFQGNLTAGQNLCVHGFVWHGHSRCEGEH